MNFINIMGVRVSIIGKKQILLKIGEFLNGSGKRFIVTPNPEIILAAAERDRELLDILNKADLAIPDGIGLKLAAWSLGKNLFRTTGSDLAQDILGLAEAQNKRVAVFNWKDGLSSAQDIKIALAARYPRLKIMAIDADRQAIISDRALAQTKKFNPEIIFCAFGAPYQEKFIFRNLEKFDCVKIGIGVGGTFDFLTGRIRRAPKIMRIAGFEWLWRLCLQPTRWKRIYNAVAVFPVKFLSYCFKSVYYRNNQCAN